VGSPANTASRLGSLRGKAAARETHAFVEKLKADLQEAQLMLEVDPPLSPPPPLLTPCGVTFKQGVHFKSFTAAAMLLPL